MTNSLRSTIAELSRRSALAAVGEFATSLAHEVRNGLTSIKVDLQRAEEHLAAKGQGSELVTRSLFSVTRLDATVSGALQVARSGRVSPRELDLRDVVTNALKRASSGFQARGVLTTLESPDESLSLRGDPDALERLFVNLLDNAGQSIPAGGRVTVRTGVDNGSVFVAITDTGIGIPTDELGRVFEPFFTTRDGGTGLGLPMARQIATAHGGTLELESHVGRGTTARVAIPRAQPD
jgi:signal transduction histidine kinase